jgi:hypothetical protein
MKDSTEKTKGPALRFLSLFVPDLDAAAQSYEQVLGVAPSATPASAPAPHPFAKKGPVVFELGDVALALYQCDMRGTHPGDVGIGVEVEGSSGAMAERARDVGGRVFFGPRPISSTDSREMAVFVLPDRHFFEVVSREG